MPLAPTATLLTRLPQQLAAVLAARRTPEAVIRAELQQMHDHRLAKTVNHSVIGIMNGNINGQRIRIETYILLHDAASHGLCGWSWPLLAL